MVHIPDLQGPNLGIVASQQLTALLEDVVSEDVLRKVVDSTLKVYKGVKQALGVSDMPGRLHYLFSLWHLESVFQVRRGVT